MTSPPLSHADRGIQYCRDVTSGRIDVCHWIKRACQRHLDDLDRWDGKPDAPYRFDRRLGQKFASFVSQMPHTKGPLAGQPIKLESWQSFIITAVFGWVHNRPGEAKDGKRRFRRVMIMVPRGNGKSALSSAIALAMLTIDGEGGADCFSLGTTRDQAKIVAKDAQQMARKTPKLMAALGVEVLAHSIIVPKTASRFEALSADGHTLDGLSVHLGILDEVMQYPTRDLYDVIETATAKRLQSLIWCITTAGTDKTGIGYELYSYLTKVLDKLVVDEALFGVIYGLDDEDEWWVEKSWKKANPNWGISVMDDVVAALAAKALQIPSAQSNFCVKHLNRFSQSESAWLTADAWAKCADPSLSIEDFRGEEVEIGLDLATKLDIASAALIFRRKIAGVDHYYLFTRNYLPEAAINESRNASYRGWEMGGYLISTPGEVTDFSIIEADLIDDSRTYRVRSIAYDPWQASDMAQRLQAERANVIEYRNTVANYSAPMKELAGLALQGRLHHDGDPVLAWAVSNCVVQEDRKGNIFPRKQRPENKIDPVVAAISAMGRWMLDVKTESIYEKKREGFLILG